MNLSSSAVFITANRSITFLSDGFTVNTGINARGYLSRGLNSVVINNIVIGIPNPAIQQLGIATRANGPLRLHSYLIRNNNVTGFRFGIYFDGNPRKSIGDQL